MFGAVTFGSLSDRYPAGLLSIQLQTNYQVLKHNSSQLNIGDFLPFRRFGRRIMLLVSYVSGMLFAIASAFSTSYLMFAVLRFFTGFCITGIVIVSVVLSNNMFSLLLSHSVSC